MKELDCLFKKLCKERNCKEGLIKMDNITQIYCKSYINIFSATLKDIDNIEFLKQYLEHRKVYKG